MSVSPLPKLGADGALVVRLFNPKLLAALIVAGVMAFVAFVLLSAYADDFRSGRDGRGHALSVSAVGFQAVVRLVDLTGGRSRLLRSEAANDTDDLLVVVLEPQTSAKQVKELLFQRPRQPSLVILPKWIAVPDPRHRGWVLRAGRNRSSTALSEIYPGLQISTDKQSKAGESATALNALHGISVRTPAEAQIVSGKGVLPMVQTASGGTLLAALNGADGLYVLADPDLMNNLGMRDPGAAQAALAILARLNRPGANSVVFDVSLNGFGRKPSVFKLPFEPPFLSLTMALFVATLLAGLHGAFRFGPEAHEERAIAFGKLALVENSAGLIQLARREHRTGGAYAELIRESAAQASGSPPNLHGDALEAYLDRLTPDDDAAFSTLAQNARTARDRHELLRAARALFKWKKDNIR